MCNNHKYIQHCPLYVTAHTGRGGSCIYGNIAEGCAVERGELDYKSAIGAIAISEARILAQCQFNETETTKQEQRARNMRLAGIH